VKQRRVDDLIAVMAALRDPQNGCPWDREQTFATIAPYTIEEAYEVADAIERNDLEDLRGELGDLLFQVVFHARMAEEQGAFGFEDVVDAIVEKMTRRHPHVFADDEVADAEEQTRAWEQHKAAERRQNQQHSLLDGVALGMPALSRAYKLQKRAARAGFDWPAVDGVLHKVEEELDEIRAEIAKGDNAALQQEIGDLLFACVNLARHAGGDAEELLRAANNKFERRFRHIETTLQKQGKELEACSLDEMDALWEAAKTEGL
jgi:nucleoside triphosphate diphosphatase